MTRSIFLKALLVFALWPLVVLGKKDCITSCDQCQRNYECCRKFVVRVSDKERETLEKIAKKRDVKIEYDKKGRMKAMPCPFWNLEGNKECAVHGKETMPYDCWRYYCSDWCADAIPIPADQRTGG